MKNKENPPSSPLETVDPMAVDELIARNPGDLTPKDMDLHLKKLIPILREERKNLEKRDNEAHKSGKYGNGPKRSIPEYVDILDDLFDEEF